MTEKVLWGIIFGITQIADMLIPIIPDTAQKIKKLIEVKDEEGEITFTTKSPTEPLFARK